MEKGKKKVKTNKQRVLEWLEKGKPITSWDAFEHFHLLRLAVVIHDLKKDGYNIKGRNVEDKNGKTHYEYVLEK